MRILVIEDETKTRDYLKKGLSENGFIVDTANDGESGLHLALTGEYDLIVLDIMLPGRDGWSIISDVREQGKGTPTLFLTARDAVQDRVKGLELGADDYLVKPVALAELLARCRAHIRRARAIANSKVQIGSLGVDLEGRRVTVADESLDLTRREWLVLEYLATNVGRIASKERLLDAISSAPQDLSLNSVEAVVSRLRAKLGKAARIRTIRGLGYRLDDEP